jgi:NADPH2:quinone reductase
VDGCYGRHLTVNPLLPCTLGMELCGVVDAAGPGLERWLGRRITACAVGTTGAHAEAALVGGPLSARLDGRALSAVTRVGRRRPART